MCVLFFRAAKKAQRDNRGWKDSYFRIRGGQDAVTHRQKIEIEKLRARVVAANCDLETAKAEVETLQGRIADTNCDRNRVLEMAKLVHKFRERHWKEVVSGVIRDAVGVRHLSRLKKLYDRKKENL